MKINIRVRKSVQSVQNVLGEADQLIMKTRTKKLIHDESNENQIPEILLQLPQSRTKKVIYDDESEENQSLYVQKKCNKLKKKQEILLQAAQQDPSTCPVCFNDMSSLQAVILSCGHMFCHKCIKLQSEKYQNVCPLCRQIFRQYSLCIRTEDGEYLRGDQIRVKRKKRFDSDELNQEIEAQISAHFRQDSDYDGGDSFLVQDDEVCEYCQCNEDMEAMIFCRDCGRIVCHSFCYRNEQIEELQCTQCRRNRANN